MKRLISILLLTLPLNCLFGQEFKAYNNYDFVPGNKIIFEDDFRSDADGEFPAHWKLSEGQAVVNTFGEDRILAITKYYTRISPEIKLKNYVPLEYSIEFDTWLDAAYEGNPGVYISFMNATEIVANIRTSASEIAADFPGGKLNSELPKLIAAEAWYNKWHHIAIAVKDKQIKVYVDQFRILVIPNDNFKASSFRLNGDASEGMAMMVKNFRFAQGGGMNIVGKKFTETKIITHGINFDYNKSSIRPESMGTLNSIVQIMKDNPELRFEIGGHTDGDGENSYNLRLSQQRADAVKEQLVKMGIDPGRFTAKGYGESKPVSNNTSPEGKANNRRVEFTKI